jgi:hypothetical protein
MLVQTKPTFNYPNNKQSKQLITEIPSFSTNDIKGNKMTHKMEALGRPSYMDTVSHTHIYIYIYIMLGVYKFFRFGPHFPTNTIYQSLDLWGPPLTYVGSTSIHKFNG